MQRRRFGILVSLLPLFLLLFSRAAPAAAVLRDLDEVSLELDGNWKIAYDPDNVGLQQNWLANRPAKLRDIKVPSCFEETPEGAGYDGVVWYYCNFAIPAEFQDKALYLNFGAVNYACRAWLNGSEIGHHEGGYHSFRFPVGSAARLNAANELVVRVVDPGRTPVDGLTLRGVPNGKESWYFNFGGIYRGVYLIGKAAASIEDVSVVADPKTGKVVAEIEIEKREGAPAGLPLQVQIAPVRDPGRLVASTEQQPVLTQGVNRVKVEFQVANPELWSPETPALYRLNATLGKFNHRRVDFGFRSFTIESGEFRLNGKPIFLKAVLYQPYYPATLAYPPTGDFAYREVRQIKESGFNMVRCHAAVAPRGLLEAADAEGLLVLEEPSLGWVYGPLDTLGKPCLAEVSDMVERDRNHPSLVAWGTISQGGGDLAKMTDLLARRILQIDPTRPVFGDWPARWTEAAARGCFVYLPGVNAPLAIAGGQMFLRTPMSDDERTRLDTLGTSSSLVFVSAIGSGGMTNLRDALSRFGGREYLEDYRLFKRYQDDAARDFAQYRLQEVCNNLDGLALQVQSGQRDAAVEMIEALRANPNADGYCYSQWRDVPFECGGGAVDVWGNWKRVLEVLRRVNEPVHVMLRFDPASTCLDRPVRVRSTVINDGALSGSCRLDLIFYRANGQEMSRQSVKVELANGRRVTPLAPIEWRLDGPTGFGRVRAELLDPANRKVSETERQLLYVNSEQWDLSKYELMAIDQPPARRSILTASGVRLVMPPGWPRSRIALAPAAGPTWQTRPRFEPVAEVLEEINREGGTLLLDCSGGLDPALERIGLCGGKMVRTLGGFVGKFFLVGNPPWFNGFRQRDAMSGEFRTIIPTMALVSDQMEWHPQVVVVDGYGRFGGLAVAERYWGAGRVIAFTLPVFDLEDRDPTARLLCSNLLHYCTESRRIGGPGDFDRNRLLARFEGSDQPAEFEWWVCGPYACAGIEEGLRRTYAPERKSGSPNRFFAHPGPDTQRVSWQRYHSRQAGRVNFVEALGERQNAVAYAMTYIYAPKQTRTTLRLGSDDGIAAFLNGRRLIEKAAQRPAMPDTDRVEITLEEGWNQLFLKVVNGSGQWEAYASMDVPLLWSPERVAPPAK